MRTTCPLDCYDACSVIYKDNKLIGDTTHPFTNGYLCPNLHSYHVEKTLQNASYRGKKIELNYAIKILIKKLKQYQNSKNLYFKGGGNFGMMQNITGEFFSKYGAYFTKGSLCDSAGEAGIMRGRGKNYILSTNQIAKSDVVVVWGRNIDTTNSHMWNIIKDKTLIVIDPIKTTIAKKAHIHLQITPRSDFELALLFSRFAYLEEMIDYECIKKHNADFDGYLDFLQSYTINGMLKKTDISVDKFMKALTAFKDKKVSFLVGVGVQKYTNGSDVLRAIDSFALSIGKFGVEGCGVSYLGSSMLGFDNPFDYHLKKVAKPNIKFEEFDLVFIQGANPLSQMPNSNKVRQGLEKSKFIIYFGLYKNETSKIADLVIPACSFLEKEDVRFSYGSEYIGIMPKLKELTHGISEYKLTKKLLKKFKFEAIKKPSKIIKQVIESNSNFKNHLIMSKSYNTIPQIESFEFIEDSEDTSKIYQEEGFYLVTPKYRYSLNSQFKTATHIYIPKNLNIEDEEIVEVSSKYGTFKAKAKVCDSLRDDCIMIYSGTKGVNNLTPSTLSDEGFGACYQEVKVTIT